MSAKYHFKLASGKVVAMLILATFHAPMMAEDLGKADRLVEAAVYASHAREEIGCIAGEMWAKKALATARRFHSSNQADRDTAGAFLAQTELLLEESRLRRKFLEHVSSEVTRLLTAGQLETAWKQIAQAHPPACDGRLQQQRSDLDTRSAQAKLLEAEAERTMRWDPKSALKLFQRVRSIDSEFPGIDLRIAAAKGSQCHRAWGRSIGKAALYTVVIAAAGAGAYYGYQQYEHNQARLNPAR
jgi:hypothetical protein